MPCVRAIVPWFGSPGYRWIKSGLVATKNETTIHLVSWSMNAMNAMNPWHFRRPWPVSANSFPKQNSSEARRLTSESATTDLRSIVVVQGWFCGSVQIGHLRRCHLHWFTREKTMISFGTGQPILKHTLVAGCWFQSWKPKYGHHFG